MVKVKIIKLPDSVPEDDKYIKLGQVYEAFELRDEECRNDFYKHFYALNIGIGIFDISPEDVEVVEETSSLVDVLDERYRKQEKILLVEDGSVDIDNLEEWCNNQNIKLIVYRNGASKPEWLNL